MTHHDLISSYIDNELTASQEQEFLISLAANDTLRNSFRTELTLKEIVHRDESLITPPRALRASVFAAVGIAAASAPEVAQAATSSAPAAASQSSTFFKSLFATKLNALFTTITLSVATLVGYVGNDLIKNEPSTSAPTVQSSETSAPSIVRKAEPAKAVEKSTEVAQKPMASAKKETGSRIETKINGEKAAPATNSVANEPAQTDAAEPTTTTVPGEVEMELPKIESPKK